MYASYCGIKTYLKSSVMSVCVCVPVSVCVHLTERELKGEFAYTQGFQS